MDSNHKTRVVHMVTAARSVGLMKGQLSYLVKRGFDVTLISSPGEKLNTAKNQEKVNIKGIRMEREIFILKDIISLGKIILFFLKLRPEVCNSGTPKAGLLGMIAARLTKVPLKIYTVRGLPLESSSGWKRKLLIFTEKIACLCADRVICISPSLERKIVDLKITSKKKTLVFGAGSSNGIQLDKYESSIELQKRVVEIKAKNNLDDYDFIIGYVGRINNSKGINELVHAFEGLQKRYKRIALFLVGLREEKDSITEDTHKKIIENPHIKEMGRVNNPVPYYYIMDVLAFPTHREGFGNVSIEAQATMTPVVTTNATGAIDTVINNKTGFIVDVGDEKALEKNLEKFIINPNLLNDMGSKGKEMVKESFNSMEIWGNLEKLYKQP